MTTTSAPDFTAIKQRQQATWAAGDYCCGRHNTADRRRAPVRGRRPASRRARARRGGRQRQRHAGSSAALGRGHVHRLRRRTAGSRQGASGCRAACRQVPGGRRRGPAVRRRQLRRGAVDLRRHVHAQSGKGRQRAGAGLPQRRSHRACQLDAGGLHRPAVQDHRQARAAACRREVASAVGHGGAAQGVVRGPHGQGDAGRFTTFDIARQSTGSRFSKPTTDRPIARSRPSMDGRRRHWRPTS